jgi:hypothetical protein
MMMPSSPSARLMGYQKMKTLPMLSTRTTLNAMRGVPGTELVRFVEGGPTSAYVVHSANSMLNSLLLMNEASGLLWPTSLG